MDLRLQPKPEVELSPSDQGVVSRKKFFVKKKLEQINEYCLPRQYVRSWKPKAELIYPPAPDETTIQFEFDFNRNVQNCFVEDYAEEVFLRTPPPCFVVMGKFKRDINNLCFNIQENYGSLHISVDDIVHQVLLMGTETSKLLDRILRLGVSLPLNFILTLLSYVAHTPEARHRGYVLSGLPCLPLEYDLSVEQQFNYLFKWDNKPTVFVHSLIYDEDLIKLKRNLRVHISRNGQDRFLSFTLLNSNTRVEEESDEEDELLPKREPSAYEPDINVSPSFPSAQLPRDKESPLWCELELYNDIINPVIKLIISRVDPQYLITVDSRVRNKFEIIQARLRLLQIWKAPTVSPFLPPVSPKELEEGDEEIEVENDQDYLIRKVADESPETAFSTLFSKKTISPKFRWELSHYNYICPVSMRAGEIVEGKTEFAVSFMKYIYFLKDKESMMKFIQNPRPYALPVRPKPFCRFIILGYPFTGKTTLAKALSKEFSIPVIDANTILMNDLQRKKNTYREFCSQKAECREMIRLTTQAWQDWRAEEEKRVNLIEEWILYIQTLLSRRIEQFYSAGSGDVSDKEIRGYSSVEGEGQVQLDPEGSIRSGGSGEKKSLEVRVSHLTLDEIGRSFASHQSTPSEKLIRAIQNKDFDFNKNGLEVEANLFFSSLWNGFSEGRQNFEITGQKEEHYGEVGEFGEDMNEEFEDTISVGWCNLLPPQSLSSFLMSKKPYTTREKRQSFKIFLEAASKVYWEPSALKSEFAKWRLPCFMDIPLCEIFLDNPLMLLKYLPGWLQERPLIPDPIDSNHPAVIEASTKAYHGAGVVSIKQSEEEVGILLRDAIEKAEREGMRVSGEVISPGGWVLDNMTLDLNAWNKLACENVFPDHIYILIDTEPEYRRIINCWWEICGIFAFSRESSSKNSSEEEEYRSDNTEIEIANEKSENIENESGYLLQLLWSTVNAISKGEEEIDKIYNELLNNIPNAIDYFWQLPPNNPEINLPSRTLRETIDDEVLSIQSLQSETNMSGDDYQNDENYLGLRKTNLGIPLEIVTSKLLNYFRKKSKADEMKARCKEAMENGLQFFIHLLTLPKKLEQLKQWLTAVGRGPIITEIEMTNRTPEAVLQEIRDVLMKPFIKKPRELEPFEIYEINRSTQKEVSSQHSEEKLDSVSYEMESNSEEDVRIFGEAGPLCVVNLERDIFLLGKIEHALRYYGKLYYFWNEDCRKQFVENPEKYAPYYSAIRCYPPLRIFITGPKGAGKTTLAKALSLQCGVPLVNYHMLLLRNLLPHSSKNLDDVLTDKKLLLSEDHNSAAKVAKEQFLKASYLTRQFFYENSPYTDRMPKSWILDKLREVQEPMIVPDFPQLTYSCIDFEGTQNENLGISLPDIPYTNMNELEAIIDGYINNSTDLTDYCVDRAFKTLWTTQPYITQGFVLENFPLRFFDVNCITRNNWVPDLVLEVTLPEDLVIERNIDTLMEAWDTKLKRETIEEKMLEDVLSSIQSTLMLYKKEELVEKKRAEMNEIGLGHIFASGNESYGSIEDDDWSEKIGTSEIKLDSSEYATTELFEDENSKLEAEVDTILSNEFPPLVFNPIFETYDAGKARITENLIKNYKRDLGEVEKMKSALQELNVPWLEVDASKKINEILTDLFLKFDTVRKRTMHKGEFSFILTMEMAEKLLQQGYYFLSKFGRWCPVQVYRMRNPIHMFRPFYAKGKVTPIAYRNYIYFIAGENEKVKFMEDPIKYTFNEPHHPNIPLRVAIIGPPKSGKTTLSTRLGLMFDMKVVTMGSALRFVLEKNLNCTFANSINSYLTRGCFLPLSLKVEALMLALNDPSCSTQGFIFDGIPFDAALTQSLAEKGKLPFVIISLVADPNFGKINREGLDLQQFQLPYKNRVNLDTRYKDWNETYQRFVQWNQATYNNLYEVNAKLSVVDIFYQAYDIIRKSFFGILYYVEYCVSDRVLPLHYLCVSQHEYDLRKSSFHNNCPVCWVEKGRLSNSSDPPPRSGLVQYKKHFYWVCPQHMEKFVENPKLYFLPHAPKWPELLAKKISINDLKPYMSIHGFGRCPVTRIDFPKSLDWEGYWDFAAEYDGKVFLCKDEKMLKRFLMQPWRYQNADTVFEKNISKKSSAVRNLGPPLLTSLPPIGFLEQTVANMLHDCLQVLGTVRPVYPNISPSVTGCVFIALYLKTHNKKSRSTHLERQYLNFMLTSCTAYSFKVKSISMLASHSSENTLDDQNNDSSTLSEDSEISPPDSSYQSTASSWTGFDNQTEKNIWGAKEMGEKYVEMKLTSEDNLIEIPTHPNVVILKYEQSSLRPNPFPPIQNCLTFLYSAKRSMQMPKEFNYKSLYQSLQGSVDFTSKQLFNPDRKFSLPLFTQSKDSWESKLNLHEEQPTYSDVTIDKGKPKTQSNISLTYMRERFIPRFQLLDKTELVKLFPYPKVLQQEAVAFDPLLSYTYTLLFSEFFGKTHILKCFNWNRTEQLLEYLSINNPNLGLTTVQSEYFFQPHVSPSMKSWTSLESYQQIFDAASVFVSKESEIDLKKELSPNSSTYNFMQSLLIQKLDQVVELTSFSYDIYEINVHDFLTKDSREEVIIQEIIPFPPLPWDINSRPYHAYGSVPNIFSLPTTDHIAHERKFSLLDGIAEPNKKMKFIHVSHDKHHVKLLHSRRTNPCSKNSNKRKEDYYVYYDFFNLPWTCFLPYSHQFAFTPNLIESAGLRENVKRVSSETDSNGAVTPQ